ncbi:hypothetical protein C791_1805 [Amycolatopsis azurea DSM 43854]|uniref:Uncharacterized protein n=1 Tax=Amycolatopsis azurea DSM 43854 TaxID=1238180 RepID=M2PTK3_9PSEU|nr:hypothetical protein C791_1805 [Amycolatopsis azurea DSM 43854]
MPGVYCAEIFGPGCFLGPRFRFHPRELSVRRCYVQVSGDRVRSVRLRNVVVEYPHERA